MDTKTETVMALLDGVTAKPWWTDGRYDGRDLGCAIIAARTASGQLPGNPSRGQVAFATAILNTEARKAEANARFIAASRELVPALLAERDAAVAEAQRLREALRLMLDYSLGVAPPEVGWDQVEATARAALRTEGEG